VLANYRQWFGPKAGLELYEQAERDALAEIRQEACANHILDVASHNAEAQIRTILEKAQFTTIQIQSVPVPDNTCPIA
jgi:hypothetical protein